jgi:hypothetical protein
MVLRVPRSRNLALHRRLIPSLRPPRTQIPLLLPPLAILGLRPKGLRQALPATLHLEHRGRPQRLRQPLPLQLAARKRTAAPSQATTNLVLSTSTSAAGLMRKALSMTASSAMPRPRTVSNSATRRTSLDELFAKALCGTPPIQDQIAAL